MIRILQIVPDIDGGGVGSVVYNYISHMNKQGMKIDILTSDHGRKQFLEEQFSKYDIRVITIISRKKDIVRHFQAVENVIKNGKYDIVHSHEQNWSYFYLKLAKKYNAQVRIAHSHLTEQNNDRWKIRILNCLNPLLRKITTGYFACGELAGRYMWGDRIVDSHHLYIMNNAIDINRFKFSDKKRIEYRKKLGICNKTVIGHVGRFDQQKNHIFLIDLFYKYKELNNSAVLVLVGMGALEPEIRRQVEKYGLEKDVLFLGLRDDVAELLNAFDCFVLPSLFEGLPVVGIEAQTNGVPCVFSDAITDEVKLLDSTTFLPLEERKKKWCAAIENAMIKCNDRENAYSIVEKKGFSIEKEAERLREYYIINAKKLDCVRR